MEPQNDGGKEDIYAAIDTLPNELELLLDAIAASVSNSAAGKFTIDENDKEKNIWDGKLFQGFTDRMPEYYHKEFLSLLKRNGINYAGTFKKTFDQGIGKDKAKKVFYLSARAQKKDFTDHIRDYIKYCKDTDFESSIFHSHKDTIEKLLSGHYQRNTDYPTFPLQDHITIRNEIDKIKENIGFYPYGKDQVQSLDNAKLTLALKDVDHLLLAAPQHIDLLALKARILAFLDRLPEALKVSEEAYAQNSENEEVMISYAITLKRLKRFEDALDIAIAVQKNKDNNDSPLLAYHTGTILMRLGKHEEAIKEFECAINVDPDFIQPYYTLSQSYHFMSQIGKRKEVLKSVLNKAPDNPTLILEMVSLLGEQEKEKQAIEFLSAKKDAIKDPNRRILIDVIQELSEQNYQKAQSIMLELVEEQERNPLIEDTKRAAAYGILANVFSVTYERGGRKRKYLSFAKECYEKSLKYNPDDIVSLESLALLNCIDGNYKNVKKCLDRASSLIEISDTDFRKPFDLYIRISRRIKQFIGTRKSIKPLIWYTEKYENDPYGYIGLANEYISAGNFRKSKAYLEKSLSFSEETRNKSSHNSNDILLLEALAGVLDTFFDTWPDNDAYIQTTLDLYDACTIEQVKILSFPYWIENTKSKGKYLRKIGLKKSNIEYLQSALDSFNAILAENIRHRYILDWINVNICLAMIHEDCWRLKKKRSDLEDANQYVRNALEEATPEIDKDDWIKLSNTLVKLLIEEGENFSKQESFEKAATILASIINTLDQGCDKWLECHLKLGDVYQDLGYLNSNTETFLKSANAYSLVLEAEQRSIKSQNYRASLQGKSLSLYEYCQHSDKPDIRLVEEAVAYYSELSELCSLKKDPLHYASVHECLGDLLSLLGKIKSDTHILKSAKEIYHKALPVLDGTEYQSNYDSIRTNLNKIENMLEQV